MTGAVTLILKVCSISSALTKFSRVDLGAYPALLMIKLSPASATVSSSVATKSGKESKEVTSAINNIRISFIVKMEGF